MSALASLLHFRGFLVQGSDKSHSKWTEKLTKEGIKVFYGHSATNIGNANIIVINHAIDKNNEELKYAKKKRLLIISRAELLGLLAREFENVIAVSGAHGKTTTTTLLAEIFTKAGYNPTVHCGGDMSYVNSNVAIGDKKFFITEACEYKDSFLELSPDLSIILNIEREHLDYFKNFDNVKKSFQKFASQSDKVITSEKYNFKENQIIIGRDIYAKKIKWTKRWTKFRVFRNKKPFMKVKLKAFGEHNVLNSLYAIETALLYNIDKKTIKDALKNFSGVKRRFEVIKQKPLIIHDYAHHPDEIKSVLQTIKKITKKKIMVVFQPHTYSRTEKLYKEFIESLSLADLVCIYKTYSSREKYTRKGSAKVLYDGLVKIRVACQFFKNITSLKQFVLSQKGYVVMILGAGNIDKFANLLK